MPIELYIFAHVSSLKKKREAYDKTKSKKVIVHQSIKHLPSGGIAVISKYQLKSTILIRYIYECMSASKEQIWLI